MRKRLQRWRALPGIEARVADLERGVWPFDERTFDGVVVTNYLHRPLFPLLLRLHRQTAAC